MNPEQINLSEADTRAKLIDPSIHKRGWSEDLIRREETVGAIDIIGEKARRRSKRRVDYTLRIRVNPNMQPVALGLIEATEHFTGAVGQQRLPADYLANFEIPLPLLSEQKRVAAILQEQLAAVEKARKAADEQLEAIKALPAALLRRAFDGEL